jgi:hypothetical protein
MAIDWLEQVRDAYDGSTSYFDANWKPDLDYSLEGFQERARRWV